MAKREVKYINKDFDNLRDDLNSHLKRYFPNTFTDFNETSAGMALVDVMAYVGDVLSFYLDRQFQELFLSNAIERKNVTKLAEMLGYTARGKASSTTQLTLNIQVPTTVDLSTQAAVPSSGESLSAFINLNIVPKIQRGSIFTANDESSTPFELTEDVDFNLSKNRIITKVSNNILQISKTKSNITSGLTKVFSFPVGNPKKFLEIELPDRDVLEIVSIVDGDGNEWFEVDYLSRSNLFVGKENVDPSTSADTAFTAILKPIPRRFIKRRAENDNIKLIFGSGTKTIEDTEFIPAPEDFVLPQLVRGSISGQAPASLDASDLLETKTLGVAPQDTVLTITYRIGGGLAANVSSNIITRAFKKKATFTSTDASLIASQDNVLITLTSFNPEAASGGENEEDIDELKNNASAFFAAQNRAVTLEDYAVRILTMPANFGSVFRARAQRSPHNNTNLQIFVLSRNSSGQLAIANNALKNNIKVFLDKFRPINDIVEIVDGQVINLGIDFIITTESGFNRSVILGNAIEAVKKFMNIKNFTFKTNIVLSDIQNVIHDNEGVRSVVDVKVRNISGGTYSSVAFDVTQSTRKGELVCPDDSIFEVKFPDLDITGIVA